MYKPVIFVSLLFLSGCGSTGVVQMEPNKFMVSVKSPKIGFVSASEEKAEAYKEANQFCASRGKAVETVSLETRNSGAFRSASAELEFRCN